MGYTFENIRILLVEDNKPMLDLAKSLLETFGVKDIFTAENGRDAFRIFCNEEIDLVIADWMMKPMDGITLTQKIRTDPNSPNHFAPIILVTGFSQKHRVFEARDAGVTEFLVKPFNVRDLYRRVCQVIEKPRQFVRSDNFFGPDRRRISNGSYAGPLKRFDDRDQVIDNYVIDF